MVSSVALLLSPKVANLWTFSKVSSGLALAFALIENIFFIFHNPFMVSKTS